MKKRILLTLFIIISNVTPTTKLMACTPDTFFYFMKDDEQSVWKICKEKNKKESLCVDLSNLLNSLEDLKSLIIKNLDLLNRLNKDTGLTAENEELVGELFQRDIIIRIRYDYICTKISFLLHKRPKVEPTISHEERNDSYERFQKEFLSLGNVYKLSMCPEWFKQAKGKTFDLSMSDIEKTWLTEIMKEKILNKEFLYIDMKDSE
ncbi:hypothetical protein HYV10_02795 [Candidatus Dependentiae bacterium]|nr:hypothetical protein [Candidatus Dependentiae bacterium]